MKELTFFIRRRSPALISHSKVKSRLADRTV
jgi:hypothetical protein